DYFLASRSLSLASSTSCCHSSYVISPFIRLSTDSYNESLMSTPSTESVDANVPIAGKAPSSSYMLYYVAFSLSISSTISSTGCTAPASKNVSTASSEYKYVMNSFAASLFSASLGIHICSKKVKAYCSPSPSSKAGTEVIPHSKSSSRGASLISSIT